MQLMMLVIPLISHYFTSQQENQSRIRFRNLSTVRLGTGQSGSVFRPPQLIGGPTILLSSDHLTLFPGR